MKLMQLRYFQGVCKYGNVTKAAQELHISQPTITSSIQELEAEFGVNLFCRSGKRLQLTKEGEFFLKQATLLLEDADSLEMIMKDLGGKNNPIHIGIPPMIGAFLFPDMFSKLKATYPDINLEIQEYGSLQATLQVQNEMLDLAIVILDDLLEKNLNSFSMVDTQLLCCVSKGHPLASKSSISLEDLKDEPMVLMKSDSMQNSIISKEFEKAGIKPNVILYSSQIYTIKEFIKKNNAVAFLFETIANKSPDIVGIPLNPAMPQRIGLIWKKGNHMFNNISRFVSFVRKYHYE